MSDPRATLAEIAAYCSADLPMPTQDEHAPVFSEPWQAQAFAMTVHLHAQGLFTWSEWAQALTAQIKAAAQDDGSQYYQHWLDALEHMVLRKQVGTADQLHALEHAWEAAAERTPHGQPIELRPEDFHGAH